MPNIVCSPGKVVRASAFELLPRFRGDIRQVVVGKSTNPAAYRLSTHEIWRKSAIGTALEYIPASVASLGRRPEKGRTKMFGLNFHRQLVAAFGALLMSTVAVSAAVGPASTPTPVVSTYA